VTPDASITVESAAASPPQRRHFGLDFFLAANCLNVSDFSPS
jgi:hypothetical protein